MLKSDVDMIQGLAQAARVLADVTNTDRVTAMLLDRIANIIEPPKVKPSLTAVASSRAEVAHSDHSKAEPLKPNGGEADADPIATLRMMAQQPDVTIKQLSDYAAQYGLVTGLMIS